MRSTKIIWVLFTVVALIGAQTDYNDQGGWGGDCQTGNEQSPIDIMVNNVGKCK